VEDTFSSTMTYLYMQYVIKANEVWNVFWKPCTANCKHIQSFAKNHLRL